MKLREAIFWQPDAGKRWGVILVGVTLTLLIGYLRLVTGLAYGVHVFFSMPVVLAAWYAGASAGYGVGGLAVLLWLVTDHLLAGDSAAAFPLLFNAAARLAVNLGTVWLLKNLRHLLKRKMQLAREDALTGLANRREFSELGRRATKFLPVWAPRNASAVITGTNFVTRRQLYHPKTIAS